MFCTKYYPTSFTTKTHMIPYTRGPRAAAQGQSSKSLPGCAQTLLEKQGGRPAVCPASVLSSFHTTPLQAERHTGVPVVERLTI